MDIKAQLLAYNKCGLVVIPMRNGSAKEAGKHPFIKGWPNLTLDESNKLITDWDKKYSIYNVGFTTGKTSGITVVDIDNDSGGLEFWTSESAKHDFIRAPTTRTGSGTLHYYFAYDSRFGTKSKYGGRGIDIRNDSGAIVAPPSIHPTTKIQYKWEVPITDFYDEETNKLILPSMPNWLAKLLLQDYSNKKTVRLAANAIEDDEAASAADTVPKNICLSKPKYGDTVTVYQRPFIVDEMFIWEVLEHIDCPSEVAHWGGFMQNIKSLVCNEDTVQYDRKVYELFDEWCQKDTTGYDEEDNRKRWSVCPGRGDFCTMIGIAVKNDFKRDLKLLGPIDEIRPIMNRDIHFTETDLLNMRRTPHTLDEIKEAIYKCIARVGGNKSAQYVIKVRTFDYQQYRYDFAQQLHLGSDTYQCIVHIKGKAEIKRN